MSKPAFEELEILIAKAARNKLFRDALVLSPVDTARAEGVNLDEDSVAILAKIKSELNRFGGNTELDPDDACSWAAGVLLTKIIRPCKTKWDLSVTTILRNYRH